MMEEIIVCSASEARDRIQPHLNRGWIVKHCVPVPIAAVYVGELPGSTPGFSDNYKSSATVSGNLCFILEKS